MTIDCTLNMDCRSLPSGADLIHSDLRPFLMPPQYESYPFKKIDEPVGKIESTRRRRAVVSCLGYGTGERIVHNSNVLQVPRSMPQIQHRFTTRTPLQKFFPLLPPCRTEAKLQRPQDTGAQLR
jgi:hypothetical protein